MAKWINLKIESDLPRINSYAVVKFDSQYIHRAGVLDIFRFAQLTKDEFGLSWDCEDESYPWNDAIAYTAINLTDIGS